MADSRPGRKDEPESDRPPIVPIPPPPSVPRPVPVPAQPPDPPVPDVRLDALAHPGVAPPVPDPMVARLENMMRRLETVEAYIDVWEARPLVALSAGPDVSGDALLAAVRTALQTKGRLYRSALHLAQQLQGNTRGVVTDLVEWLAAA